MAAGKSAARKVLVLGAGKIGGAIVDLLHATGDYQITLADTDKAFLAQAAGDRASRFLEALVPALA